jgi:hypothetical protein
MVLFFYIVPLDPALKGGAYEALAGKRGNPGVFPTSRTRTPSSQKLGSGFALARAFMFFMAYPQKTFSVSTKPLLCFSIQFSLNPVPA